MTNLSVPDEPKQLRETLCAAQSAVHLRPDDRAYEHAARLGRLIDVCDELRPLGPDGKHGNRHTAYCGCDDVPKEDRMSLPAHRPDPLNRPTAAPIDGDPEFWHGLTMWGAFGAVQVRDFAGVALAIRDTAERSTEDGEPVLINKQDARKLRDLLNIATARGVL